MPTRLQAAPAAEPVSQSDVKGQLSVSDEQTDVVISRRIKEAREWAEQHTGRSFITQTWDLLLDAWPQKGCIELPRGPVQSVSYVKYIDSAGALQTIDSADYKLASDGRLVPAYGKTWPAARDEIEAITVRYVAGYGDKGENVPGPVREAILLTVGHWMDHQPAIESGVRITRVPFAVEHLLSAYRLMGF